MIPGSSYWFMMMMVKQKHLCVRSLTSSKAWQLSTHTHTHNQTVITFLTLIWLNLLWQSIYCWYLALLVLFSKTCHLNVKCCQRDRDAWHETQRKWGLWQADMHMRARAHAQITTDCASRSRLHLRRHAPKQGRTWISQVVAVFHQLQLGASASFNLWRHYLLTHLSSSKWFLFISCESPNQSWKLNAIQRSHCFQPHSLSLWEWMAAAENSDVLSHRDGESLNVSCDLYRRRLWLKALAGASTNHVTHLTHYIWVLSVLRVSLSHPLAVSSRSLVHVKRKKKERRKKGNIKFHSSWSRRSHRGTLWAA